MKRVKKTESPGISVCFVIKTNRRQSLMMECQILFYLSVRWIHILSWFCIYMPVHGRLGMLSFPFNEEKRWNQVMKKFLFQIDFNTKTIFNIEKGIIKKQFPFSQVKACEDTERRRFSIVFHGRQDYELEAVSLDDKRKVSFYSAIERLL